MSLAFKAQYLVTHPMATLSHFRRERILAKMFHTNNHLIHDYIEEARKVIPPFRYGYELALRNCEITYAIVRMAKPNLIIETGIGSGMSSKVILEALRSNGTGRLISIDISDGYVGEIDAPQDGKFVRYYRDKGLKVGFLVPERLRGRWDIVIGASREKLPVLLKQFENIDLFLHDSEHSYENMMFEFNLAWKYLVQGGILLSDDIDSSDARGAFQTFCRNKDIRAVDILNFGIALKESRNLRTEEFGG